MATYINGSKPSLNPKDPNLDIEANKKLANINTEGIMENGAGSIYMSQIVEPISKEEAFLPVVYIDNFGNIKEIVRSSSRNDTYHGTEFVLEPAVDGQNPD